MLAGQSTQQQPPQRPPNLVLSGAPLQPEFGGGAPGGAGRVANQRIVLAGESTPPDPNQFGLVRECQSRSPTADKQVELSMTPRQSGVRLRHRRPVHRARRRLQPAKSNHFGLVHFETLPDHSGHLIQRLRKLHGGFALPDPNLSGLV